MLANREIVVGSGITLQRYSMEEDEHGGMEMRIHEAKLADATAIPVCACGRLMELVGGDAGYSCDGCRTQRPPEKHYTCSACAIHRCCVCEPVPPDICPTPALTSALMSSQAPYPLPPFCDYCLFSFFFFFLRFIIFFPHR
jgi:hypothetical protein